MVRQLPTAPASRARNAGAVIGAMVAYGTGTTHASADTASTVTHGALDENGNAYAAANLKVIAISTSTEAPVYVLAATTATVISIASAGTAVPYNWYLFVVN